MKKAKNSAGLHVWVATGGKPKDYQGSKKIK